MKLPANLLIAVLFAFPALAQQPAQSRPQTVVVDESTNALTTADKDAERSDALTLTLDEAIRTAAERNLGVSIQSYDFRMFGENFRAAHGIFDWFTFATLEATDRQSPAATRTVASQVEQVVGNAGVEQLLATGGVYRIGFNNRRSESNDPFAFVNPSYSSSLGFSFDQPLLRNFGVDVTRRGINIARNTLGVSREEFRNAMLSTVLAVEQSYLDLVFARQNLDVKRQSLSLARDQSRITQIRIDVGASAPLDILQPRVAIATREEEVIIAEAQVRAAEDRLRQLMNLPPEEWSRPILPADPVEVVPLEVSLDEAVARAFEQRPEIRQARFGTGSREIEYNYARNQVLPRLDFSLDYGFAGIGGNRLIFDPVTGEPTGAIAGGYSDAFQQVTGFDFPSWTVGFNVGVPVTNIGARADRTRARLNVEQSTNREAQIRQEIAVQVRQTVRDIDTAQRQIVATRAARDAAEQNVEAERRRYENGLTTNFNVLLVQQELSDARSRELASIVGYRKAVANYHRAVGDLLEVRGITVDEPERYSDSRSRFEAIPWLNFSHYSRSSAQTER
jgi:outer membrane protein